MLDRFVDPTYLEIGVSVGDTFHAVRAKRKVAVDPAFGFTPPPNTPEVRSCALTSDECFGDPVVNDVFDVIDLDGLHTFEQTLRDFTNSIERLNGGGVIVIDDVLPNSYHASIRDHRTSVRVRTALGATNKSWMGDVYRLVYFIRTSFQQFETATVMENHGELVVWRRTRSAETIVDRRVEEVGRLPFEATLTNRDEYRLLPLAEILRMIDGNHR
jgi:hypothetical protein